MVAIVVVLSAKLFTLGGADVSSGERLRIMALTVSLLLVMAVGYRQLRRGVPAARSRMLWLAFLIMQVAVLSLLL
ncbi:MAG TPA: hypothetical protein VF625_02445 [Longimicrobium sp.]